MAVWRVKPGPEGDGSDRRVKSCDGGREEEEDRVTDEGRCSQSACKHTVFLKELTAQEHPLDLLIGHKLQ